jgi:hypothetical protein
VRKFDAAHYGTDYVEGRGRRSFVVRLRPVRPARVRWIVVEANADDPVQKSRKVLVRVGSG